MKTVILLLAICIHYAFSSLHGFLNFKSEMQAIVKKLANAVTDKIQQRCMESIPSCNEKSYNFCEGTSEKWCNPNFPSHASCDPRSTSTFVSKTSSIRFAPGTDPNNLADEEKRFVCQTAELEQIYKEVLDSNRRKKYTIAYIGSIYGSFRQYPTVKEDEEDGHCKFYDPRGRPWYISATTGPKNIIIMIDISGTMALNKIIHLKKAAIAIINTLINVDFIGVVAFNDTAKALKYDKIQRATEEIRFNLTEQIQELSARGNTDYEEAFSVALNLLKNATVDEYGAPCENAENVIMFFSDGNPSGNIVTSDQLIDSINSQKDSLDLTVFSYGIGEETDTNFTFLKQLSCAYNGMLFNVSNIQHLVDVTQGYYQYISIRTSISAPVWSQPYNDAFGFGRLFTVSLPIYYHGYGFKRIVGVAGLDILHSKMLSYELNEEEVINNLIGSTNNCPYANIDACEREFFRKDFAKCGIENCTVDYNMPACNDSITDDIFLPPFTTSESYCCGVPSEKYESKPPKPLDNLVIILVTLLPSLLIMFVITVICLIKKYQAKKRDFDKVYKQLQEVKSEKHLPSSGVLVQKNTQFVKDGGKVPSESSYSDSDSSSKNKEFN